MNERDASVGEHAYFYEDEVFRVNSRGQVSFGLVLDNCEGTSSDTDDDRLQRGDLRVVWHPSGRERVVSDRSVGLADRALMPGDVVRRMIKGKDTQRGYCRDIVVTGAVQVVGTNLVLPTIPSERLQPLEEFTGDLAVCLESWVGTTKIVHSKMKLVSSDGSRLMFPDVSFCLLEDCLQRRRRGGRCGGLEHQAANEFYPGQTVVGPLGAVDNAVWLHITKEMEAAKKHKTREHKFTVESVETESVGVHWQCRALGEQTGGGPPQQPPFLIEGEDLRRLKLLNLFEPCTLQVGAKNFLTLTADDTFCTKAQWKKTQNKVYRALRKHTRPPRCNRAESATKELNSVNAVQIQESNNPTGHPFRIPSKSKRRLSAYNREGKIICAHNAQPQNVHENKSQFCIPAKETTIENLNKEDNEVPVKMDVDIVIVNDQREGLYVIEKIDREKYLKGEYKDADVKFSISPQRSDEGSYLDVPDKTCNGKNTSSDRSCSPDNVKLPEKQKKLRKTKVMNTNHSRSDSPAIFNGDKTSEMTDDSDSWCNTSSCEGTDTDSCGTWSSQCSSSTNNSMNSGRGKKSPRLVTKFLKGKRLKRTARKNSITPQPKPGDRVVVETLCTKSKANVVWQDGTLEFGIPSTELYPIHHLDGQECFPGDFVISGASSETSPSHRDYGVVQNVDHYGRTAVVKWFRTYTNCQDPIPQMVSESEVSVYDLKDHPDFQYRPGTVVIRVANFTGSEATCTAGQVMDNFPSGQVNVHWVDGHMSMCWPQDLYKVGEYDSDEGDIWADEGSTSDDSWETQSSAGDSVAGSNKIKKSKDLNASEENVLLPDISSDPSSANISNSPKGELPKIPRGLEPRAAIHIERGLNAMARMEEILSQNPSLQSHEIMRKLLTLYKDCRFLDRLMGTSFFHEDHFQGLLERVRERGGNRDSASSDAGVRRAQNQVLRLFSKDSSENDQYSDETADSDVIECTVSKSEIPSNHQLDNSMISEKTAISNIEYNNIENLNAEISNTKEQNTCIQEQKTTFTSTNSPTSSSEANLKEPCADVKMLSPSSDGSLSKYVTPAGSIGDLTVQASKNSKNEDSGLDSQSLSGSHPISVMQEPGSSTSNSDTRSKQKSLAKASKSNSGNSTEQLSNRNVCLKLCSLISIQLMKACAEVSRRRNSLYVPFLNRLMNAIGAKLPYRFSLQFHDLTVTMTDEKSEEDKEETSEEKVDPVENSKPEVEDPVENVEENENAKKTTPTLSEVGEGFVMLDSAPTSHRFRVSFLQPSEPRVFHQAISREIKLLKSDLPPGVWVRGYEDRMDLLSIMIAGPAKTPYEDGLFLFDVQLGAEYPRAPPLCHYISYCSDRLNPNLYEDGKVCVSLLGTWSGRGVEVWGKDSSLLQVIVSLQGLILCAEPYFNEAGFDKQKGSQQGRENSRMYNEMVLLKLVQSLTKMIGNPPDIFKSEIYAHQSHHASKLCTRLTRWMHMSEEHNVQHPESPLTPDTILKNTPKYEQAPEYPLIPASKGFCLTLRSSLESYRNALVKSGIKFESTL